jgi:hypothetical protein
MTKELSEEFLTEQLDELYDILNFTLNKKPTNFENTVRLMMRYSTFVTKVVEDLMTEGMGIDQNREFRNKIQSIYVHEQLDAIEEAKANFWRKKAGELKGAA